MTDEKTHEALMILPWPRQPTSGCRAMQALQVCLLVV
jgi:hypothetical protein